MKETLTETPGVLNFAIPLTFGPCRVQRGDDRYEGLHMPAW